MDSFDLENCLGLAISSLAVPIQEFEFRVRVCLHGDCALAQVRLQLIGEGTMVAQPSVLKLAPTIVSFCSLEKPFQELCALRLNLELEAEYRQIICWFLLIPVSSISVLSCDREIAALIFNKVSARGHRFEMKESASCTQASQLLFFGKQHTPLHEWVLQATFFGHALLHWAPIAHITHIILSTTKTSLTFFHWTGIFRSMSDALSQDGVPLPFYKKAGCGLVSTQMFFCRS